MLGKRILTKREEQGYIIKKKTFQKARTFANSEAEDRNSFDFIRMLPTALAGALTEFDEEEDEEAEIIEEKKEEKVEKKRVLLKIVEFDWMFSDRMCDFCLQILIDSEDGTIFMQETIRICIEFLWANYFWEIFRRNFLYFVVYLLLFLGNVMLLYDVNEDRETWEIGIAYTIDCLLILASLQLIGIELLQVKTMKRKYFRPPQGIWNSIDVLSNLFVVAFCVNDIAWIGNYTAGRYLASIALFLLWLKFFYFLRIFEPTEKFIRMISAILYDSQTFLLIYLIANLIFANVFYMLDGASRLHNHADQERATGRGFLQTALYTVLTGLGEFDTEKYAPHDAKYALYCTFLLCVFMIQIVLLNLLIAIMGDSFARIQELADQDHLREVAKLIVENRAYIKPNMFKDVKYIMVAQLESSIGLQSSTLKEKLSKLKSLMNVKFQQLHQNQRVMSEKISES